MGTSADLGNIMRFKLKEVFSVPDNYRLGEYWTVSRDKVGYVFKLASMYSPKNTLLVFNELINDRIGEYKMYLPGKLSVEFTEFSTYYTIKVREGQEEELVKWLEERELL